MQYILTQEEYDKLQPKYIVTNEAILKKGEQNV